MEKAALKKQLKEKAFSRVYLLFGEEPWLVRHYASRIAKEAVVALEEFNLQKFDEEASVDQIAEAVEALPMMSERKCVLVRNYNAEANASQTAKMTELLADPPESCVLVFACRTKPKRPARVWWAPGVRIFRTRSTMCSRFREFSAARWTAAPVKSMKP